MYSVPRYRYVKIQNTVCLKFSVFNALLLLFFSNLGCRNRAGRHLSLCHRWLIFLPRTRKPRRHALTFHRSLADILDRYSLIFTRLDGLLRILEGKQNFAGDILFPHFRGLRRRNYSRYSGFRILPRGCRSRDWKHPKVQFVRKIMIVNCSQVFFSNRFHNSHF